MAFLTPNTTGEAGVLRSFVLNQFAQVRSAAFGLTDEQLHQRSTVSEFTLAALVDHVGLVAEQYGVGVGTVGGALPADYGKGAAEGHIFPVGGRTGEQLLADFDERVSGLEALLDRIEAGEIPLEGKVPVCRPHRGFRLT